MNISSEHGPGGPEGNLPVPPKRTEVSVLAQDKWEKIITGGSKPEEPGNALAAWSRANESYYHYYNSEPWNTEEVKRWDKNSQTSLRQVNTEFPSNESILDRLADPEFTQSAELSDLAGYKLWKAKRNAQTELTGDHRSGIWSESGIPFRDLLGSKFAEFRRHVDNGEFADEPRLKASLDQLKDVRDKYIPVLETVAYRLSEEFTAKNSESLYKVLENLEYVGDTDVCPAILNSETLTLQQKQWFFVHYVNTIGFIPAIDTLGGIIAGKGQADDQRSDAATLYGIFQGREVSEVLTKRSQKYDKFKWQDHPMNEDEFSRGETEIVERALKSTYSGQNDEDSPLYVLSAGEGTGRNARAIDRNNRNGRKWTKRSVTPLSVESEGKHVKEILRPQDPSDSNLTIHGSWHNIPIPGIKPDRSSRSKQKGRIYNAREADRQALRQRDEARIVKDGITLPDQVDGAYSLGQSFLDNRTPTDQLQMTSEMARVVKDRGFMIANIPSIEDNPDYYQPLVDGFVENLERLGVDPIASKIIFDGPTPVYRFNRNVPTPLQFVLMWKLSGFQLEEISNGNVESQGKVSTLYYNFKREEEASVVNITRAELYELAREHTPADVSDEEVEISIWPGGKPEWGNTPSTEAEIANENRASLRKLCSLVGLLDPGTDYDTYLPALDMTLGQMLLFGTKDERFKGMDVPVIAQKYRGGPVLESVA